MLRKKKRRSETLYLQGSDIEGSKDPKDDYYASVSDAEYDEGSDPRLTSDRMPSTSHQEGEGLDGEIDKQAEALKDEGAKYLIKVSTPRLPALCKRG